jgi:hypothetical protein
MLISCWSIRTRYLISRALAYFRGSKYKAWLLAQLKYIRFITSIYGKVVLVILYQHNLCGA